MEISRQNYERYLMDYLDGNLDPEQVDALLSFLEFNPDLKEEFSGIGKIFLVPDKTTFSGKANLMKSESDLAEATILKYFDMYCISSMEDDIAEEEEEILQGIIRDDPERKDTYMLYRSTRLLPDENILYPGKTRLKKGFIAIPYRIFLPAAAAVAALLIMFQVFTGKDPEVGSLTLTDQIPGNTLDKMETNPPVTQQIQSLADTPVISGREESPETSQVQLTLLTGKQPVLAKESIPEADAYSTKERIQLAMISSKSIQRVVESPAGPDQAFTANHALRQSNTLQQYHQSAVPSGENPRLSLWMLADASVRGLNSLSEDEYHLDRKKDENGKTRRITLDTPVFGISAPLRKPDKSR